MILNNSNFISTTLGELADFQGGHGFPLELQGNKHGDYPFFKVDDMNTQGNEKYMITAANYVNSDLVSSRSWRVIPAGSIVFAKVGAAMTHNRRRILSQDSLIDNNMMAATTRGEVSVEWLYWWMLSLDLNRILNPGPVPSINQSQMAEIELYMSASNTERDNIASHLFSVENLAGNQNILVQKLKMMRTGLLSDLLRYGIDETGTLRSPDTHEFVDTQIGPVPSTWTIGSVGNFLQLQRGHDLPLSARSGGNIPIFGSNGVDGTHDTQMYDGPGVITGRSGTIGKIHFVETSYWPLNTTLFVRDFRGNSPRYIAYFLEFLRLERYSTGTGVPTLNRNLVHPIICGFPQIVEQNRIVLQLQSIDARIESETRIMNKYQKIKIGLMGDLLTGRVRVPTPAPDGVEVAG